MTIQPASKVHFQGTHRIREPAETWDLVAPLMGEYGVTRVADVTGLDVIGIPVWMAVRPLAATLSVSQGKGATDLHAKVSALMEAIELWHAESAPLPVARFATAARDLDLPYDLRALDQHPGSLLTERTRLDWVTARGLIHAAEALLPLDVVSLAAAGPAWQPLGISRSSNGLASGNCLAEAALHALYEVIERDALAGPVLGGPAGSVPVQPDSVGGECGELVQRVRSADAYIDVRLLPSRMRIPCFSCQVWSPEFPLLFEGSGAHSSPEVALSRAITEAAQGRLTAIAASRDDIRSAYDVMSVGIVAEPQPPADQVAWPDLDLSPLPAFGRIDDELAWLAREVQAVTGFEPLHVDLSTRPEFAVTKVVAPGLRQD